MTSLLDAFNEPCTRRDTSDYGIDAPIMDGPYGDAAAHERICEHCGQPARNHCYSCSACPGQKCPDWCEPDNE